MLTYSLHGQHCCHISRKKDHDQTIEPPKKRGGARIGAGRPKGARSAATIEREHNARAAVDLVLAEIGREGIKKMQPLGVLMLGMHLALEAGNLPAAMAAAEKAAPFCHARMSSIVPIPTLPSDLEPDDPCSPDSDDVPPVSERVMS